jgi:hypothetical protein
MKKVFLSVMITAAVVSCAWATPSTQIWNPSTDIQASGTWHLGIDNYFTVAGWGSGADYTVPTDIGLTYGILPGLEAGLDVSEPQTQALAGNIKYGIAENGNLPALAVGGFGFGTVGGVKDMNVLYGVAAKTFAFGRISAGYFQGDAAVIGSDGKGCILTWDKSLTDKVWASIDYASGYSSLGALFTGFSYSFSSNTSVLFAYGTYNNGAKPTVTTQLDINI